MKETLLLLLSYYEELGARRFREYKWEMRKVAFDQTMIALGISIFQRAAPILERTGLTRRRSVEKVDVE
jgi:hypothetical protein